MLLRINGATVPDVGGGIVDNLREAGQGIISNVFGEVGHGLWGLIQGIISALNVYSAEVITFGIIVCAFGVMMGPLMSSNSKWMGRMFLTFWVGVIWRVLT